MTSDFKVEIWAYSIDNAAELKLFCRNSKRNWSVQYKKYFHIPKECMDF